MDSDGKNLVQLDQWKSKKKNADFTNYLKVLSFTELMDESDNLLCQMKKHGEFEDIFSRTKLMMNEFAHRLEKRSRNLSNSVRDLKKSLEDKLH